MVVPLTVKAVTPALGKPLLACCQLFPASIDVITPMVPANRIGPRDARDITKLFPRPALASFQLAPSSKDPTTPWEVATNTAFPLASIAKTATLLGKLVSAETQL